MDPFACVLPAQMIFRRQRRQPDDLAAHRGGVLDRIRVEAADDIVEHDAGIDLGLQLREMLADQRGRHHAAVVVVLGDDRGEAGGRGLPQHST